MFRAAFVESIGWGLRAHRKIGLFLEEICQRIGPELTQIENAHGRKLAEAWRKQAFYGRARVQGILAISHVDGIIPRSGALCRGS